MVEKCWSSTLMKPNLTLLHLFILGKKKTPHYSSISPPPWGCSHLSETTVWQCSWQLHQERLVSPFSYVYLKHRCGFIPKLCLCSTVCEIQLSVWLIYNVRLRLFTLEPGSSRNKRLSASLIHSAVRLFIGHTPHTHNPGAWDYTPHAIVRQRET